MTEDTTIDAPAAFRPVFSIVIDAYGVVLGWCSSNVVQTGATEVSAEIYAAIMARGGAAKFDGTTVSDYTAPAPAPGPIRVLKVDIWRRSTDDEAVRLVGLLNQQTVRLQRMFTDATVISSADDMWPTLLAGVTSLFGADRAAVLLAPSA